MSALGQKRTCALRKAMSALPSKADMCSAFIYVCFGPKADIAFYSNRLRLGGVEVDDKRDFR